MCKLQRCRAERAPDKDRWPVLKTDGHWVLHRIAGGDLGSSGGRRAVNQERIALRVLALIKPNRFLLEWYRYTHRLFGSYCHGNTSYNTYCVKHLHHCHKTYRIVAAVPLHSRFFFFAPVRQAFMSGNGEEQMITPCHPQNGHLTRSLKYFDQNLFTFGCGSFSSN